MTLIETYKGYTIHKDYFGIFWACSIPCGTLQEAKDTIDFVIKEFTEDRYF